jgi:hypothetical protein
MSSGPEGPGERRERGEGRTDPERGLALEHGLALLRGADEMWVCADDVSEGMAGEIAEALRLGVPVYRIDVGALRSWVGWERYAKVLYTHAHMMSM